MKNFKYSLQKYSGASSRSFCPRCERRSFVIYLDTDSGEVVDRSVGRCNHEVSCGYHYPPREFFRDNGGARDDSFSSVSASAVRVAAKVPSPISLVSYHVVQRTLRGYEVNNFYLYLNSLVGAARADVVVKLYKLGSSKLWGGACIFWQIDVNGNVRTGKIMLYDRVSGKRVKKPFAHISWVHKQGSFIRRSVCRGGVVREFNLRQCFFGEHLISKSDRPIAIVESEKSAMILSVYYPQLIWLATGGLSNLNSERCEVLRGRRVILFPDLGAEDRWREKVSKIDALGSCVVSTLLHRHSSMEERKEGLDMADFVSRFRV